MGQPVDLTCGHRVAWTKAMYETYKATKVLSCPTCNRRAIPQNDVARAAREATAVEPTNNVVASPTASRYSHRRD